MGTTVEIISGSGSYNPNPGPTSSPGSQPQAPSQGTQGQRYIVQKGDTLWRLSPRFGVSLDAPIKANNLSNPNALQIGQELIIPKQKS